MCGYCSWGFVAVELFCPSFTILYRETRLRVLLLFFGILQNQLLPERWDSINQAFSFSFPQFFIRLSRRALCQRLPVAARLGRREDAVLPSGFPEKGAASLLSDSPYSSCSVNKSHFYQNSSQQLNPHHKTQPSPFVYVSM